MRSGATGGFNVNSWAVSVIGTYSTTPLPSAAYGAVRDLTAWKLLLGGRDAIGQATLTQSQGGSALGARWTDGQEVVLPVVSGHRDAVKTECPGNLAYLELPRLRRDVDQAMGASPRGNLEFTTTGFRAIRMKGWAFDPETSDPWFVWVDIDGAGRVAAADGNRPDVGAANQGNR